MAKLIVKSTCLTYFPSRYDFRTAIFALDIEYMEPHEGVSPSFKPMSSSIPGWWGGYGSANTLLNNLMNSSYHLEMTFSSGHCFRSFVWMAWWMSYRKALSTASFPFVNVLNNWASIGKHYISSEWLLWPNFGLKYLFFLWINCLQVFFFISFNCHRGIVTTYGRQFQDPIRFWALVNASIEHRLLVAGSCPCARVW